MPILTLHISPFSLAPPTLNIVRAGENVVLYRPTNNAEGFQLEYATILPASTWTPAGAPSIVGGEYVITDSISGVDRKFHRLRICYGVLPGSLPAA